MPDPKPERPDLDDYLKYDEIIDFDDPSIEEAAEQLTEGLKDNISKAQAIYEFVRVQIFHSFDINATSVTIRASEVLEKGHGICYAQAHLLAALMRASGIPAGFCYQILRSDCDNNKMVVHGYNAIYLDELDKWVRLDASKNDENTYIKIGFDKDLSDRYEKLDKDEYDDPVVYINPGRRVIKSLKNCQTVEDLKNSLPERI